MVGEDYRAGTSYKFRVPLRDTTGALQSGKTATVTVYLPNDGTDPSPPTVSELGSSGIYGFSYAPATAGAYTFRVAATGCLPVVWTIQVRSLSRDELARESGGNLAAVRGATDAYLDAAVSSRAPAATALSNLVWTDARAGRLDNLDATVSSRAPAATALSTTTWTDARAARLDNLDATVSSRAPAGEYDEELARLDVPVSTRAPAGEYDEEMARLDVPVSSRAPAGEYDVQMARLDVAVSSRAPAGEYDEQMSRLDVAVSSRAPAATALSKETWTDARAAALDNLDAAVSSRAEPGDAMSLTAPERAAIADAVLDEDVQVAPAEATTLRAAAKAAWAQGFGKWVLSGRTLTLYGPDGTTPVRVFTLDDPDSPTERVPE
ncbi:MAG: hypothetical protein N2512_08970 [Armatimonadetes bacterium]|nr:hypothetical protein [Armatimonadota bacterium]